MSIKILALGLVLAGSVVGCDRKQKTDKAPADEAPKPKAAGTAPGAIPDSNGEDSTSKDKVVGDTDKTKTSLPPVKKSLDVSGVQPVVEGTWVSKCVSNTDGKSAAILKIQYTGSVEIVGAILFKDYGCTDSKKYMELREVLDFKLQGNKFDTVSKQQFYTPLSESAKTDLQDKCPELTLEIGAETDVSTCKTFSSESKTKFDLLDFQDGKLYSGDTNGTLDGTTESKRPIHLDGSFTLTKQ